MKLQPAILLAALLPATAVAEILPRAVAEILPPEVAKVISDNPLIQSQAVESNEFARFAAEALHAHWPAMNSLVSNFGFLVMEGVEVCVLLSFWQGEGGLRGGDGDGDGVWGWKRG